MTAFSRGQRVIGAAGMRQSVAEAFIVARLGEERRAQYGVLPAGTDAAAIVARH